MESFLGALVYLYLAGVFFRVAQRRWNGSVDCDDAAKILSVLWPLYMIWLLGSGIFLLGASFRLPHWPRLLSLEAWREHKHQKARRAHERQMEQLRWNAEYSAALDERIFQSRL